MEVISTCIEYGLNVNQTYQNILHLGSGGEPGVSCAYSYLLKDAFIKQANPDAESKAYELVESLIHEHGATFTVEESIAATRHVSYLIS
ncbi:hypothetical protein CBS470a_013161 [Colletotrichum nupharicola]|nr:hypothetical protein CBS470a_013161 [Colletotrichum nupharicola]